MFNAARGVYLFQRLQGGAQHSQLTGRVSRLANSSSKGIFDGGDARYAHSGGSIGDIGERDGGHAGSLDLPLHQSNGPAAERSSRD